MDEIKNETIEPTVAETPVAAETTAPAAENAPANQDRRSRGRGQQGRGNRQERRREVETDGIDTRLLLARRVSRMYHGGRRMRFSSFMVAGDRSGRVGVGGAKGLDVPSSQRKATQRGKAAMFNVPIVGNTIPHEVEFKYKSTRVLLKPAAPGTGIVAGAVVKAVAELAGIKDLLTKVHGSTNAINVANATVGALKSLRKSRL